MGRILQQYKSLFEGLKKPLHRLYFLYGQEEYVKKEFITELTKTALPDENRTFNLDIIHGDDFDLEVLNDRISSFPLFATRRVVILKKFDALTTPNKDFVIERLKDLPESLIFVAETTKDKMDTARMKSIKALADKKGFSFRFQYLSDNETVERVRSRLKREEMTINVDALELLVASVGNRLIDLVNELEKIILFTGEEGRITREGVSRVVGKYRVENLFSFLDELGGKNTTRLITRMNTLIESGEEPIFVQAMLIRRVIQLLQTKLRDRDNSPGAKKAPFGTSPYFASQLGQQARRFEVPELEIYLGNLRWADVKMKSSSISSRSLLETSIVV